MRETHYRAKWLLTADGVQAGWGLAVADGLITWLGPWADRPAGDAAVVELGDTAVIPGLVDAHSHSFQRALRGRTQHLDARQPDADFWTWREAMYRVALRLDPDELAVLARMTFLELVEAGVTAVGEFHYLHHGPDGRPYADANLLAHRVIDAARSVGLRIALLRVLYQRGGAGRPAGPAQRRFVDPDVDTALARVEALADHWAGEPGVTVGVAPHSVRAVPGPWLTAVAGFAARTGRVVHIHACEQPAELAECRAEYGAEPVAVLADHGVLGPRTTLVHATWLEDGAADRIAAADALVCACATTERDLGDGFLPARALWARGVRVCRGSDSHVRIDPWEDLRLIEYHERLQAGRRNVLAVHHPQWGGAAEGDRHTAAVLWPVAAAHGAQALGLPGGVLAVGQPADFVTVALDEPTLAGASPATLLADLVFSADARAVRRVVVGGREVVRDGRHPQRAAIVQAYRALRARLDLAG